MSKKTQDKQKSEARRFLTQNRSRPQDRSSKQVKAIDRARRTVNKGRSNKHLQMLANANLVPRPVEDL